MKTNLKAKNKSKKALFASKQVEAFPKEVKTTLIKEANSFYDRKDVEDEKNKKTTIRSFQIKYFTDMLHKSTNVVVPTYEANSFITIVHAPYNE